MVFVNAIIQGPYNIFNTTQQFLMLFEQLLYIWTNTIIKQEV